MFIVPVDKSFPFAEDGFCSSIKTNHRELSAKLSAATFNLTSPVPCFLIGCMPEGPDKVTFSGGPCHVTVTFIGPDFFATKAIFCFSPAAKWNLCGSVVCASADTEDAGK